MGDSEDVFPPMSAYNDYIEAEVRGIQRFLWMIKQLYEVG